MLLSIVRLYFVSSPLYSVLIALVLFVFGPQGSLLYKRIQPLSRSVLPGPVPLQTNEETRAYARTTTLTVKEQNRRTALVVDVIAGCSRKCSDLCTFWFFFYYQRCGTTQHVCISSVSPTMSLVVNNPWSRSPNTKVSLWWKLIIMWVSSALRTGAELKSDRIWQPWHSSVGRADNRAVKSTDIDWGREIHLIFNSQFSLHCVIEVWCPTREHFSRENVSCFYKTYFSPLPFCPPAIFLFHPALICSTGPLFLSVCIIRLVVLLHTLTAGFFELMIAVPPLLPSPFFICPCLSVSCLICLFSRFTSQRALWKSCLCNVFSVVSGNKWFGIVIICMLMFLRASWLKTSFFPSSSCAIIHVPAKAYS